MIPFEVWTAVAVLNADYWQRVDRQSPEPVDALYVENGVMQIGALHKAGRAQIRAFFEQRNAQEEKTGRTTRHVAGCPVIKPLGEQRWQVQSTVQVLAGNGDWPLPSAVPATVADFDDLVVQAAPGDWRFERRTARVVFTGPGAAAFTR